MSSARVVTFLFTDIEGSTRLWEQEPERMRPALARHDAIARDAVESHRGVVVKMSGDGVHAAFDDPLDALNATLKLQQELACSFDGLELRVRCGIHAGTGEHRDNDFFGPSVNRAARIMSAAHGGQILVSEVVANLLRERLPAAVSLRDLGSARLRDLTNPEHLYQLAHPELRQDFPPLRSLEATPNNLPQQVSSFVGREHELADVKNLLATTRLLTLVGVGGIGKSRLSLQVAADAIDDFPDGVWLVELAPVTDGDRVAQAAASVLGVKEEVGRPVIDALLKYAKDRQLLIVLDNCEHLVEACAALVRQLLHAAPKLKVMASSREYLRTSGEHVYAVPALSIPESPRTMTSEALSRFEATQLFIERATAAQPAFKTNDNNASAIITICRQLDGIPLAIELAAARIRALSVDAIAARLNDRFHLLGGGDRAALPRQQTLRALIDWSYDLLSEPERIVLRRLAVFVGGWTLEAAEAVVPGGVVDASGVLDLLTHLVEKSLVVLYEGGDRYRMLDTIREYARNKLADSEEADALGQKHLNYYSAFAEKAQPELIGPQQERWLARLDSEQENILSANAWCDETQVGAEQGLKLVSSMKRYWIVRGLLELAHRVTVHALARPGAQKRNLARYGTLFDAGQIGSWMGRYAEAHAYLEESLAIAKEIGDAAKVARVLQPLGFSCLGIGDIGAARHHFEEGLALAQQLGNKRELAAALNALAQLHRAEGAMETAEPLYSKVLALARELSDRESIAIALLNLAMVSIARGHGNQARKMLLEVAVIVDEIESSPLAQSMLEVSAGLAVLQENWTVAARMYWLAEAQAKRTGLRRDPADEAFLAPLIAKARFALGDAAFDAFNVLDGEPGYREAVLDARAWLEAKAKDPQELGWDPGPRL